MKTILSTSCSTVSSRGALIGALATFGLAIATSAGCSPESATTSSTTGVGGSGGGESACHVTMNVTLPSSPLTTDYDARLQRAGADFLLRSALGDGNTEGGSTTAWARSTRAGVMGPQVDPAGTAAQYLYGLTAVGKATAGDQLIAISRGGSDLDKGEELLAAVMDETTRVAGPTHVVLNAHNAGQTIQATLVSSLDGLRAVFVDGNIAIQDPLIIVLGGDGVRQGAPVSMTTTTDHLWHCLDVIPTATAAAVSTVETRDGKSFWHLVEVDAKGTQAFESSVDVTDLAGDGGWPSCPRIVLTKGGFTGSFLATAGTVELVAVDRGSSGATRIATSIAGTPQRFFASMGDGYAFLTPGKAADSPQRVRLVDKSGHAVVGDLDLTQAPGAAQLLVPSAPGTLLVSTREGDGPLGWIEVTCDAQ